MRKPKRRPTITDVAQLAGVSKSTVSHVLNGTRYVEDETKQRVLNAIEELGYRPSGVARSLTTKRTNTIGIIIADATDNFFGEILRGIISVFGSTEFSIVVCNTEQRLEREEHYLNLLLQQRVDGIIAMATSQRWEALEHAEMKHLPLVFVDRTFEGMDSRPYVGVDNFAAAYRGTQHLISCGHDRIGLLAGAPQLSTMRERRAGFEQALQEAGLPLRPDWIVTSPLSVEAGRVTAARLLSSPDRPQALFLNNNLLSLGTLLALKDIGMKSPDDVGLVAFDDHPWSAVSDPPLTVVRQPAYEIGKQSAEIMQRLLEDETPDESKILFQCELVVRGSCGGNRVTYNAR